MLALYTRTGSREPPADLAAGELPPDVVWLDLIRPEPGEIAFVERTTGLAVPGFAALSEIESSSRLRADKAGTLYLSAPLVFRAEGEQPLTTPVGFVLSRERLITVRFEELMAFASFAAQRQAADAAQVDSAGVYAALVEAIVDRAADVLEHIAGELDILSHRLFQTGPADRARRRRPARETADLRVVLRRVGRSGDLASKIRDSLLGIGRMVPFAAGLGAAWLPPDVLPRLETLRQDIASLTDYDAHVVNKVQLLLDATLGLINMEQNDIIKVLTIVSVVGVPPTLIASMYGMNFKYMPELSWDWGYPYGLALIALSAILPMLWFRWRGWF